MHIPNLDLITFNADAYDINQLLIKWSDDDWSNAVDKNPEILLPDMRLR